MVVKRAGEIGRTREDRECTGGGMREGAVAGDVAGEGRGVEGFTLKRHPVFAQRPAHRTRVSRWFRIVRGRVGDVLAWPVSEDDFTESVIRPSITLINTLYNTWSLSVNRGLNACATENVVVDQPLGSTLGSSFGDITFTAIEDQDDGTAATKNGLAKTYFDNFAFTVVPDPSGALLGLLGCLGFLRRRR